MKADMFYVAIFAAVLMLIPASMTIPTASKDRINLHLPLPQTAVAENTGITEKSAVSENIKEEETEEPEDIAHVNYMQEPAADIGVAAFKILDESTGKVTEVALRDYVRGAVAAEMPVTFHTEALKAQAVAAHTYALYCYYAQQKMPDPKLKGAAFSADPSNMEVYITEEKARAFYGETYAETYWNKICEAADSVLPYIMVYNEEPIVAAYHAISGGKTEAAENVWNGAAQYLQPADSSGDYLAPNYETSAEFSVQEVKNILSTAYPNIDLSMEASIWFSDIVRSDSGYITSIDVGGTELHGKDIRRLFGLRSHNIDIFHTGESFEFVAYGYGHGVGLSQYGADFLARQGYTFDEILDNYYSEISLKMVSFNSKQP